MAKPKDNELNFSYDNKADVLYVSIGRSRRGIGRLTDEGVIIRYSPKTHKVVGLTILDFEQRFKKRRVTTIPTHLKAILQPL